MMLDPLRYQKYQRTFVFKKSISCNSLLANAKRHLDKHLTVGCTIRKAVFSTFTGYSA